MPIITREKLSQILKKTRTIKDERVREQTHARLVTRIILRSLQVPRDRRLLIEGIMAHISDTSHYASLLAKREARGADALALLKQHVAALEPAIPHFPAGEAAKARRFLGGLESSFQVTDQPRFRQTGDSRHPFFQNSFHQALRSNAERALDFVVPAENMKAFEAEQTNLAKIYLEFAQGTPRN